MPLLDLRKIFWAVDPFSDPIRLQRSAAWAIQALAQNATDARIYPIYVLGDWPDSIVPQRRKRYYLEKIEAFARDSMQRITHAIPLKNLEPVQVVFAGFDSVEQGARSLVSTAANQGADLLVASTRANRYGGGPFTLPGSFVEALTNISELPLMTVNPGWRYATGIPSILFPTDLSQESQEWFLKALDFARMTRSGLTLFHKVSFPLSQSFESAVQIFPELRDLLYKKIKGSQAEAKRWSRIGKQRGVRVTIVIDSKMTGSLSEAVIRQLKRRPASVVMAPPISITYPRSTVMKLMKLSPFPMIYVPALLREEDRAFGARVAA